YPAFIHVASAPPEVETVTPRAEPGCLRHIHRQIEVLTDPKRPMSVAAERDRLTTLLPPPAQQVHRRHSVIGLTQVSCTSGSGRGGALLAAADEVDQMASDDVARA